MCLLDGLSVCLLSFRLKNGIPGPDGADVAIEGRRGRPPFGVRGCVETKNIKHGVTETQRENGISQQNKISVPLCLCVEISF